MFLLVPAYPGCPGSKAVKRSLLFASMTVICTVLPLLCCLQWGGFSLPELNNFLRFLDNEEHQQISLIQQNCHELKHLMTERMRRLSSVSNPLFSQSGDTVLY